MQLLFSSTVASQDLEVGKEYRPTPQDPLRTWPWPAPFRALRHTPEIYRFEGEEPVDGKQAARFTVADPPRPSPDRSQPITGKWSSSGKALVSLEDGLLLRLTLHSESTLTNEINGRCNSLIRRVEIERKSTPTGGK